MPSLTTIFPRAERLADAAGVDSGRWLEAIERRVEAVIEAGLDRLIERLEVLAAALHESGIFAWLDRVHPLLRDGAQIGVEITILALKRIDPAIVVEGALLLVASSIAPHLLVTEAPEIAAWLAHLGRGLLELR